MTTRAVDEALLSPQAAALGVPAALIASAVGGAVAAARRGLGLARQHGLIGTG